MKASFKVLVPFLSVTLILPLVVFAVDRTAPFTPGQTIDPGAESIEPCGPLDDNCFPSVSPMTTLEVTGTSTLNNIMPGVQSQDIEPIITTVDSTGDVGLGASVDLGDDGFARIAYFDRTNDTIKYARCLDEDCITKNIRTIESTGNDFSYADISLKIGSDNLARIAYHDEGNKRLKYAICNDTDCSSPTIQIVDDPATGNAGRFPSLALDSSDNPFISYHKGGGSFGNGNLYIARYVTTGGSGCTGTSAWNCTSIDPNPYDAMLNLGDDGFPRIAIASKTNTDWDGMELHLAICSDPDCTSKTITTVVSNGVTGYLGENASIAIKSNGNAVIAITDYDALTVKLIECTNLLCTTSNISDIYTIPPTVGAYPNGTFYNLKTINIVLGSDDRARVLVTLQQTMYVSGSASYLTLLDYILCSNTSCSSFSKETLDSFTQYAYNYPHQSIDLGQDGYARIAYYESAAGDLNFIRLENNSGAIENLGSSIGSLSNPFRNIYTQNLTSNALIVNGNIEGQSFTVNGNAFASTQWTTSGSNIYYNDGNVGVGTTQPSAKLQVKGGTLLAQETNLQKNASGVFATKVDYLAGNTPEAVTSEDFNNDGYPDLAVSSFNALSVFMNNGDGTFETKVDYPKKGDRVIDSGDLNNDGDPDIVASMGTTTSVFINNGDGTFATPVDYLASGGGSVIGVALGDFNEDGFLDIVGANYQEGVLPVFINNGDGTFAPYVNYSAEFAVRQPIVSDFNNDGDLDLAVSTDGTNNISVLFGNGDGTFDSRSTYPAGGPFTRSIDAGDLDGDGDIDIVAASWTDIGILMNNGNGTFATVVLISDDAQYVQIMDLNGDGRNDIVSLNSEAKVHINNGNGTFAPAVAYSTGFVSRGVSIDDYDQDGAKDLAVSGNGVMSILMNTPSTMFVAKSSTGYVGIGGVLDPDKTLVLASPSLTNSAQLSLRSYRGALVNTSILGGIEFVSNDTNLTAPGLVTASIQAIANTTHTASDLSTDLIFSTTNVLTNNEKMRLTSTGNLGIGTSTPWKKLSVAGGVSLTGLTASGGSDNYLCLSSNNEVTTGASCPGSSERFKHDIQTLSSNLDEVMKLRPVTFEYNDVSGTRIGLIAEEVNAIDPRLVFFDEDGTTPRGVRYQDFVPLLAGAIQEQQINLDSLNLYVGASTTDESEDYIYSGGLFTKLASWAGNIKNKIEDFFAKRIHTETLCVGKENDETCITKDQLDMLLNNTGATSSAPASPEAENDATSTESTPDNTTGTSSEDVIIESESTIEMASSVSTSTESVNNSTETSSETTNLTNESTSNENSI